MISSCPATCKVGKHFIRTGTILMPTFRISRSITSIIVTSIPTSISHSSNTTITFIGV